MNEQLKPRTPLHRYRLRVTTSGVIVPILKQTRPKLFDWTGIFKLLFSRKSGPSALISGSAK